MENNEKSPNVAEQAFPAPSNRRATTSESTPRWVVVFGVVAAALFLCFVVLHLTGHGLGHHGSRLQAPEHAEINPGKNP